jgi:hypothetical protein
MPSGPASSLIFPSWMLPAAPGYTPCARSSTHSSMSCAAAAPSACCRTTSLQQEDRLSLLQDLASGWHLGEDARRPTQACASAHGPRSRAERRGGGQPVGKDHRCGWHRARLRRGQEGQGQKASFAGGYAGFGAPSAGPQRQGSGSGRHQVAAELLLTRS